jgi:hypothetical protein
MKVQFMRKVHNKIQIEKNIEIIYKKRYKTNNYILESRIIIWNDFGIVVMTITKIPILHKPIPMKHHRYNCNILASFTLILLFVKNL